MFTVAVCMLKWKLYIGQFFFFLTLPQMNMCYFWSLTFQREGEGIRDKDKIENDLKLLYTCMKLLIF